MTRPPYHSCFYLFSCFWSNLSNSRNHNCITCNVMIKQYLSLFTHNSSHSLTFIIAQCSTAYPFAVAHINITASFLSRSFLSSVLLITKQGLDVGQLFQFVEIRHCRPTIKSATALQQAPLDNSMRNERLAIATHFGSLTQATSSVTGCH